MNLSLHIAGRYLFARKSHNVINIISTISAIGMAIGTAALILILSIYNGFDTIINSNISDIDPDLRIEASNGRYVDSGAIRSILENDDRILCAGEVLEDRTFIDYTGKQGIVSVKGVTESCLKASALKNHTIEGNISVWNGDLPLACVGSGLSYKYNIRPCFVDAITFYYPDKNRKLSVNNPSSSLRSIKLFPGGTFSVSSEIDNTLIIIPLEKMRELTGEDRTGAIELLLYDRSEKNINKIKKELQEKAGEEFRVLDHYEIHPELYRMMKIEKGAIFLILLFVVIIVAFNIFGSMSMLIIEKDGDISLLKALGASDKLIRRIFFLEGWLVSLLGLAAGLAAGIGLTFVQQEYGLVKMPGNFIVESYPVALHATDIILTAIGVAVIGMAVSFIAVSGNLAKGSAVTPSGKND